MKLLFYIGLAFSSAVSVVFLGFLFGGFSVFRGGAFWMISVILITLITLAVIMMLLVKTNRGHRASRTDLISAAFPFLFLVVPVLFLLGLGYWIAMD